MINESFVRGMQRAVALWREGWTWEAISHHERYDASYFGRGMFAAIEGMAGWTDVAEREARAHGFTREEAHRVVADVLRDSARSGLMRSGKKGWGTVGSPTQRFRKGEHVQLRSYSETAGTEWYDATVVTGAVALRKWEGVGRAGPAPNYEIDPRRHNGPEPHLLVRSESGTHWEPVAQLRPKPGRSGFMHQKPPTGLPKQIGSHRFSIVFYTREHGRSGGDAYAEEHADDFDQARRRGYLKLAAHPGLGTFHVYDWKYPQHAREGLPWIGRQQDLEKHSIDQLLTMPRKHGNMKLGR